MEDVAMILVQNMGLSIKNEIILKDINMEANQGEIWGIVGRNGSGKTMLMKCICGFVRPTEGKVFVNEKQIGRDADYPSDVGMMIEVPGFIPYYSGYKNLKLLADINGKIGKKEILESMGTVGLDGGLKRPVRKYSLGMRQRLGIAQAIMERPSILILDEPFNGLDMDGVKEIRELLLRYREQGKIILIASHISEDIEILCDHVINLNEF
ncbi:MAG: ATP-binding cassette domain-containing protein [Lachnospiraceae bacterium]|nr:ATP-binding cassette domain-containing protein [Lachnospiraceae bacterium]